MAVERTELRQKFDEVTQKLARPSLVVGVAGTALAVATSAWPLAILGGANIYVDYQTEKGKGKSPEKQSAFSMPSLLDKMGIGTKGSDRLNQANTRLAYAAGG